MARHNRSIKRQNEFNVHVPEKGPTGALAIHSQFYSGPIPPAAALEHYERVFPGASERIFSMAENQSSHRRDLETIALQSEVERANRGQKYAFGLALISIVGAVLCAYLHETVVAATLAGTTVFGVITAFIGSKNIKKTMGDHSRMKAEEGNGGGKEPQLS